MSKRARVLALATSAALLAGLAAPASASPGLRIGLTDDPDALFAGLQWRFDLAQAGPGQLFVRPGVDLAPLVDGPITFFVRGNAHFGWDVPLSEDLSIYPLIAPDVTFVDLDDDSDLGVGLNAGGGLQFSQFALELWFGIEDSPDITFAVSFNL